MSAEVPMGIQEGQLTPEDLVGLRADQLVDIIVWQQYGLEALNQRIHEIKGIVDRLSVDPNTGILTMGALGILADVLTEGRILEILRERGHRIEICFLDVDELKKHNSFGGHDGGNVVLAEVARRLKRLYRRRGDLVVRGLMQLVGEAESAADADSQGFDAQGRFARGDEMVAVRFKPPGDVRRIGANSNKEDARILKGFEGATAIYPILPGLTPEIANHLDPEGRFEVDWANGLVKAPVTITVVNVQAPMPANRRELRVLFRDADQTLLDTKNSRMGRAPTGSAAVHMELDERYYNS